MSMKKKNSRFTWKARNGFLKLLRSLDRDESLIENYLKNQFSKKDQIRILRKISTGLTGIDYFGDFSKRAKFQNEHLVFQAALRKARKLKATLLDDARLWNLYTYSSAAGSEGKVIEFGTYRGGGIIFLTEVLSKKNCEFYAFDTFIGHSSVDKSKDANQFTGDFDVTKFPNTKTLLQSHKVTCVEGDVCTTLGEFACNGDVDFIHLDLDLYIPTKVVLSKLEVLLRKGGICIVDDYGNQNCPGIYEAVQEFKESKNSENFIFITPLSAQMVIIKIA